ncbi:MAG: UvrD-helicase domain-containing protein, partial [Armatimonadia bacterium]
MQIASDHLLDDVESPSKVSAGPGAGKTHWLTLHVGNVCRRGRKLGSCSRVLCITYTNVGLRQLRERLGATADRVECATIHAFLYEHVVAPYLHLLVDGEGEPLVAHGKVDGHREHMPMYSKVEAWLTQATQVRLGRFGSSGSGGSNEALAQIWRFLSSLAWEKAADGDWRLCCPKPMAVPQYFPRSEEKLASYKQHYWRDGIIDHDDVLRFAWDILGTHEMLRRSLAAR